MRKNGVAGVVGFAIGSTFACVIVSTVALAINDLNEDKSTYRPLNIANRTEFLELYRSARDGDAAWTRNPEQVALKFITTGRTECLTPSARTISSNQSEVVIVVYDDCGDDSVAARKFRLELGRDDEDWELRWAGRKQKCARDGPLGVVFPGWHSGPCP